MPRVLIKDDLHTSEENFSEFQELKEDFDSVLAEVSRENNLSIDNFSGFLGMLFYLSSKLFFSSAGLSQRNNVLESDIKPLDIEFHRMIDHLTKLDKLKVYSFLFIYSLLGIYWSLDYNIVFTVLYLVLHFAFLPIFNFIVFLLILDPRREEYMTEKIMGELESGNSVLAYMGAAHAGPVKKRLEQKGTDVERESSRKLKIFTFTLNILSNIVRPVSFARNGY